MGLHLTLMLTLEGFYKMYVSFNLWPSIPHLYSFTGRSYCGYVDRSDSTHFTELIYNLRPMSLASGLDRPFASGLVLGNPSRLVRLFA